MTPSKRTLEKWRKESLVEIHVLRGWDSVNEFTHLRRKSAEKILQLTQILLDQHLLQKE